MQLVRSNYLKLYVTVPRRRACAEDDDSQSERVDLCCRCGETEIGMLMQKLPLLDRPEWVKRVRKAKPVGGDDDEDEA